MPTWLIIILLAILAVGLFVLAMSLTLIFKGHHIDSEISTLSLIHISEPTRRS